MAAQPLLFIEAIPLVWLNRSQERYILEKYLKTESVLSGSLGQDNILVTAKLLLQPGDHSWVEGQEDGHTHLWKKMLEQVRGRKKLETV